MTIYWLRTLAGGMGRGGADYGNRNPAFSHSVFSSTLHVFCCVSEALKMTFKGLQTPSCLFFTLPSWSRFFFFSVHVLPTESQVKRHILTGASGRPQPAFSSPFLSFECSFCLDLALVNSLLQLLSFCGAESFGFQVLMCFVSSSVL